MRACVLALLFAGASLAPLNKSHAADPLPAETRLVGVAGSPSTTRSTFTVASAQDLVVTLTDFQVPGALSSANLVLTQGGGIVASAKLTPPAATASVQIPGAVGQYTIYVFGEPGSAYSVGTFGVCVAPKSDSSNCIQDASIAGNISAQAASSNATLSTLSQKLVVTTAGSYTFTFADDDFPVALGTPPSIALFQGSTPVSLGIVSGTSLNLSAATYTLLAVAQADPTAKAGLYGITVSGPAGVAPPFAATIPVGSVGPSADRQNSTAQTLTLKLVDLGFPAALASAEAVVTAGGAVLTTVSASSSPASFSAPAGTLSVWSSATAGAGAGSYELTLGSGTATLLDTATGVNSGNTFAYGFETTPVAAGGYQATATDFQFPQALTGLQAAVAQNGVVLQRSATAAPLSFQAAAGPVLLLVAASPPANGNGLFDINLQTAGAAPQFIFDTTQGVSPGGLFDSQTIDLGISADFDAVLTDLQYPAQFQNLALVVSHGGAILGKIFGGGKFSFSAAPGSYQLTFIATPAQQQDYGLYAVQITYSPPTVTLSASPTDLTAGSATTLTWTTADATSCMASGGSWTGSKATGSGNEAVIVSQTTTYTLTCTGPGGSAAKSVTVTANPAASTSHGGGSLDVASLLALLGVLAAGMIGPRARRARRA